MALVRYKLVRTLSQLRPLHGKATIYYALNTCWWGTKTYTCERHDFPCGPRGEVLMMTEDVAGFLSAAEDNPEHYGRYGLQAFEAALDGNITADGKPWSLETWDDYNRLIMISKQN
jgi:hypothetical protein